MFYSVIETRDFSLFNQSAQALLKGYFINIYMNRQSILLKKACTVTHLKALRCYFGQSLSLISDQIPVMKSEIPSVVDS